MQSTESLCFARAEGNADFLTALTGDEHHVTFSAAQYAEVLKDGTLSLIEKGIFK